MRRGRLAAVAAAVTMVGAGWAVGGVQAGTTQGITVLATATCDGEVTATYEYQLFAERELSAGLATFTQGVAKVNVPLPDVPPLLDSQIVTDTLTNGGYAVGDVVIVDVTYTDSVEGVVTGFATVTIPECPTDTEPPATEAPVDTEAPVETEAPVDTSAPAATDAASPTEAPAVPETEAPVEATPSTLPSTGNDSLPTGLVAGVMLLVGVALVVLTVRRGRTA